LIFQLTNISLILFVTTFLNSIATFVSWRRKKNNVGLYFAFGLTFTTVWTLAAGLDYAAVPIPLKVFFAKLEYLGYNAALAFLGMFALSYAGHDDWLRKSWVRVFFVFAPLSNILVAWTNEWHGLLWTNFLPSEFNNNVVIFEHGPLQAWEAVTGYLMIMVVVGNLWQASRQGSEMSKRQGRWLFLASLVPIGGNLLYLLDIKEVSGVDWSSVAFSFSALCFFMALYDTHFLDIVPIARHTIIEQMDNPILVLDIEDHVVDINPSAIKTFDLNLTRLRNISVHEVMADWPGIVELVSGECQTAFQSPLNLHGSEKVFDIHMTPLTDTRGVRCGKLIVFRDITRQFQVEQELLASEERYRTVADYTYDWGYWIAPDGKIQYMTPSCKEVTGYTFEDFLQNPKLLDTIILPEDQAVLATHTSSVSARNQSDVQRIVDFRIRRRDGQIRWISHVRRHIRKSDGTDLGLRITNRDITDRKRVEEINLFRVKLWEYAASHSFREFIQMALGEICSLTESLMGYYSIIEGDQGTISLQAWIPFDQEISMTVPKEFHYQLDEAGLWRESFYRQIPVIYNGYVPASSERLPVIREKFVRALVVPVVRGGKVVALLALGNRPSNYTQGDAELASNLAIITWVVMSQKMAEEELRQTQDQLVEQQSELARSEERQRMARDLHDSVNQSIHSMVLFSETLEATLKKRNYERARRLIERLQESARQSLKETRLLLYELQSGSSDKEVNLIQDLETRLSTVERRAGVRVQFVHTGVVEYCPLELHANLYWLAVEALNNAIKHAQAREVRVALQCSAERLVLEINDNGIGFDLDKVGKGGMGLGNMRARADIMGGTLNVISKPRNGTTVRFMIEKPME